MISKKSVLPASYLALSKKVIEKTKLASSLAILIEKALNETLRLCKVSCTVRFTFNSSLKNFI